MGKAKFVKSGGAIVTIALIILGVTLPSTPWIDENRAIYVSIVALVALMVGGALWFIGISLAKSETAKNSTTHKFIDAYIQSKIAWGLWFTGTRVRVEKALEEIDAAKIMLLNPDSNNKGLVEAAKRANVSLDAVQSDINHFTRYALEMPKKIEVGWYSEYRNLSFTIFDPTPIKELSGELTPNSENAWIILSVLDPNAGAESRLTMTIHKKKDPRKFDGYYSEFKEWWSRREEVRLQGGNLIVDK